MRKIKAVDNIIPNKMKQYIITFLEIMCITPKSLKIFNYCFQAQLYIIITLLLDISYNNTTAAFIADAIYKFIFFKY